MARDQPMNGKPFALGPGRRARRTSRTRTARWPASPATPRGRTSCGGCHLPIEANWKTDEPQVRGRGDAQLRDLQSAGRARRHVPARPPHDDQGQRRSRRCARPRRWCCRRPTSTASGSMCSSRRSRRSASPARPSRRTSRTRCARPRPRPAATATSRRPTTTTRSWRSCCCSGTNFVNFVGMHAWVGPGRRHRGGARHRMERAAGGVRLLSAALRLSRLLQAACRAQQSRADRLDARQDLRQGPAAARPIRPRTSPTSSSTTGGAARCLQLRGEYLYVAEGKGGFRVYDVASDRQQGHLARRSSPRRSRRSARTPTWPSKNATCMALPTNQSDRARRATRRRCARRTRNRPFHPIYHYAVDHRRRGRPDPGQRRHARRRRPAQQHPASAR